MDGQRQERLMHFHPAQAMGRDIQPAATYLRGPGRRREWGTRRRGGDEGWQVLLEDMYSVKQHLHREYVNFRNVLCQ